MSASTKSLQLKSIYKPVQSIESIYSGGKVAITNDGRLIITTFGDEILVSDLTQGLKRVATLPGDSEVFTCLALTPDNRFLVTTSRSLQMTIWDMDTYRPIRTLKVHDAPVLVMDIDSTSSLVATGSADSTVKVWDLEGGFCTHNFKGHQGLVSSVKFHPDTESADWVLVSGGEDGNIRCWNMHTRACVATLSDHTSVIRGLAFSPNCKMLLSSSRDRSINVWRMDTHKLIKTIPTFENPETIGFIKPGTNLALPNGKGNVTQKSPVFYTGGERGIIQLWELNTSEKLFSQAPRATSTEVSHQIVDILYQPQANRMVAMTTDQNITTYSLGSDEPEEVLSLVSQIAGYNEEIIDLAYLGPEETHLVVASNSESLRVYNLDTQTCGLLDHHTETVLCLDTDSSGTLAAAGSRDKTLSIWHFNPSPARVDRQARCVAVGTGHTESVGAVAFSRADPPQFLISGGQDRTIKRWNLGNLAAGESPVALESEYTVKAHEKDINTIAVAPNDQVFATGSQDRTATLWSTATGGALGHFKGHKRGIWKVQFSPVDQILATGSGDHTIKLWSLSNFSCLKTFEGHTSGVVNLRFLTAGLQLASVGSDALLKLWTIKSDECVMTADHHEDKVWALAVSRDESHLVTGGGDSTIRVWEDFTQQEIDRLNQEQADTLVQEQTLTNLVRSKQYRQAIALALQLDKPRQLFQIFKDIMAQREDSPDAASSPTHSPMGDPAVDHVLATLSLAQLDRLLLYIRDWNTNAKQCEVAHAALQVILDHYQPEHLLKIKHINTTHNAIIPFAERHYQRLDNLVTQSYMIDYTLHAMNLLAPFDEPAESSPPLDN
ncbi:U3 small nucleolar RNA-associated protein [Dimargaris cristalligena]|nr:U3 small nucleolar RNA-associated protein [Dimargaris cristalligena]